METYENINKPFDEFLKYTEGVSTQNQNNILRNIFMYGWERPTIVQQEVIPAILNKVSDIVFQAPSGQGKTGAYLIPIIWSIPEDYHGIYAMIVLPTRELAIQVCTVAKELIKNTNIELLHFIGKIPDNPDAKKIIKEGSKPIIVIGTMGKISSLVESCKIITDYFIVDEADNFFADLHDKKGKQMDHAEILNIFFDVSDKDTHLIFSSATYSDPVKKFIESNVGDQKLFHSDTKFIYKEKQEITLEGIKQEYIEVEYGPRKYNHIIAFKAEDLISVINDFCVTKSVIFVNSIKSAKTVYNTMVKEQFNAIVIHSEMDQSERNSIIDKFRKGVVNYLIATDLIARGIDINDISHVFNLEIPNNAETYVHRIGRSGRHGRVGTAVSIVDRYELEKLQHYCNLYSAELKPLTYEG